QRRAYDRELPGALGLGPPSQGPAPVPGAVPVAARPDGAAPRARSAPRGHRSRLGGPTTSLDLLPRRPGRPPARDARALLRHGSVHEPPGRLGAPVHPGRRESPGPLAERRPKPPAAANRDGPGTGLGAVRRVGRDTRHAGAARRAIRPRRKVARIDEDPWEAAGRAHWRRRGDPE